VRPLASGVARVMMETFSWSYPYTRGVLRTWKLRAAYCKAVLAYSQRINLDGSVSAEEVDDRARDRAQQRLDRIAVVAAEKAERLRLSKEPNSQAELCEPGRAPMPVREVTL
jgi:sRNA-binding protein